MDAVSATICDGGRAICRKYEMYLTICIKPSVSALSQPPQMAAHASDWEDPSN